MGCQTCRWSVPAQAGLIVLDRSGAMAALARKRGLENAEPFQRAAGGLEVAARLGSRRATVLLRADDRAVVALKAPVHLRGLAQRADHAGEEVHRVFLQC